MQTFTFNPSNQPVRVEMVSNKPWFVAKDVCDALTITNNRDAVAQLDDDEKLMSVIPTSGQGRQMWLVNESGLYNLIFQSRKAEARAFRKWVTSEVLPSIRKMGGYVVPERAENAPCAKALPAGRVKPRERSAELGEFYRELRLWVRSADVDKVAEMSGVRRKSVLEVLGGNRMGTDVLELLVAYAKENRFDGRLTDIASNATRARRSKLRMEQLRIDFMDGHLPIGKEGGAL